MIRARSLFLIPCLGSVFLLIPVLGIPLYLGILFFWWSNKKDDIGVYFKGGEYRQNELSDDEIAKINMLGR